MVLNRTYGEFMGNPLTQVHLEGWSLNQRVCMCRIGENVANITLVDSASVDVWLIWSTVAATSQHLDDNTLLL